MHPLDTILNLELRSIAFVCVNCFVLISGYFGIKWRLRSLSNLMFQIFFWLCIGIMVNKFFAFGYEGEWSKECWEYLRSRWFISAYISLYVMTPIINAFVDNTDQKTLGRYILCFYIFSTLYGYFIQAEEFNEGMSMISLVGIYLTGAYLRRYQLRITTFKAWQDFAIYLFIGVLLVLVSVFLLKLGIAKMVYGYLNPFVCLASIYLFLCFSKLNIGQRRWINYVAASSFAVFLFHFHPLVYGKYQEMCRLINQTDYPFFYLSVFFVLLFIVVVLIDNIRIKLFNVGVKIISWRNEVKEI